MKVMGRVEYSGAGRGVGDDKIHECRSTKADALVCVQQQSEMCCSIFHSNSKLTSCAVKRKFCHYNSL